ncbi:MAG: 2-C-methyl-D-erythritol 4-phosphate cytidylyltransferase [Elusimicrobiota bacterium]|jgi:2-C-methyl-D-erythritol 4-phosphate cytidylyltransferase|nr:2-C-methyl-D-erythritol 4-phosphate cytidylyltransferase [Elusimicrobiota bacterium]
MIAAAIIAAGGGGKRFGSDTPKQFLKLAGKPVFLWSVEAFCSLKVFKTVIVSVPNNRFEILSKRYKNLSKVKFCCGASERFGSIKNALNFIDIDIDFIAVHDAARPLINKADIEKVLNAAIKTKAAIAVEKTKDTIKAVRNGKIIKTLDRKVLWNAQTPQIFEKTLLLKAYSKTIPSATTDDSQLVERLGIKPSIVETDFPNFKITTKTDFNLAQGLLKCL